MMRRREFVLLLGVVAVVAAVPAGTGAFSATEMDRSIEVQVVEDSRAYLGVEHEERVEVDDTPAEKRPLTVTNQFPGPTSIMVWFAVADDDEGEGPDAVESSGYVTELGPGDARTLEMTVECGDAPATETIDVVVTAKGDGVRVKLARTVTLECTGD